MKQKIKKTWIWWVLIILWCSFIFYQSSKPAVQSGKESLNVVFALNSFVESLFGRGAAVLTDNLVRKTAHFIEYMILGGLLLKGFAIREKFLKVFALPFISGVIYAITDEFHQSFVPGRSMRSFDVMIDSIGVFVGLLTVFLCFGKKKIKE